MENSDKKENWFVRILIVAFCLLIASMIAYTYFGVEPKGEINTGVITLLLILLVLILSESFDNFAIGKLISITREAKKKEKEVQKLEKEKTELLSQLITISSTQHQTQQHTNVYGDYHAERGATVERASEQELKAKETDEEERANASRPEFRVDWRKVESFAMQKYVERKDIHASNVIPEAKLVTQFHGIDPVSNYQPIFDGYYKDDEKEVFIEFKPNRGFHMMLRERIYVMLSKINHYQNVKGVKAHLELIWLNVPDEEIRSRSMERFTQDFEPAIASGLLRISEIDITSDELEQCKREV
jgi:Na+-transporting methylmalonyl-CoA/oxaloacetate decarboxylase gamma subunit